MEQFSNIVVNIPHSSMEGAIDPRNGWNIPEEKRDAFSKEVFNLTDTLTDKLFDWEHPNFSKCKFLLSRFVCDVERLENDEMESVGQGILYSKYGEFTREITPEIKETMMKTYHSYLDSLASHINPDGTSLLIDCHSFPREKSDIDICIGFNEDKSRPSNEVIDFVRHTFQAAKLSVGINTPYSNSITPHIDTLNYKSFMIEVNKKCYLHDNGSLNFDTPYYPALKKTIEKIYDRLLK